MLKPFSYKKDKDGLIHVGEISIKKLAEKYQTPLYIICEKTLRLKAREYKKSIEQENLDHLVIYASKALNTKAILKIIKQESLGLDVVSGGELYTALEAGFPSEKIIFHGNNKSYEEIEMAIKSKILAIMLDSFYELDLIEKYLEKNPSENVSIMIRIIPGIECHTHEYIKTGSIDSKFGFNLSDINPLIKKFLELQKKYSGLKILGLHAHIGSQIFETQPHADTVSLIMKLYKDIKDEFGLDFEYLNVGGGLGIKYLESDDPPDISSWIKVISTSLKNSCNKLGLKIPILMVEPGRSLVGPAGITIYKVGSIKNIPQLRNYLSVDGGMADNPRPITYQSKYIAELDSKDLNSPVQTYRVVGKFCESGDVLIPEINLPEAKAGDLLVVYATGAYNYSMASNYNRVPKPAMILVNGDKSDIIVARETYKDLLARDLIPNHLE